MTVRWAAVQAVGCDPDQFTPGMLHRLHRLSARPEFDEVVRAHRTGLDSCPGALGCLAEWILACQVCFISSSPGAQFDFTTAVLIFNQVYASTARELGPRQELVEKAEQSLPHRAAEYKKVPFIVPNGYL